jgi:uncharacterized protein YndB with AHSA1/START domain
MSTSSTHADTAIEADPRVPIIRMTREFDAPAEALFRAHTDPDLFSRWVGPSNRTVVVEHWDATDGGSWRFLNDDCAGDVQAFRGCFHTVRPDRIVQTFTWEGMPDSVALETLTLEDLGDGRSRLVAESLCDSFEGRDGWLASGMETGVNEGYDKLDALLAGGDV